MTTPPAGIRLAGGARIPTAPSLGNHRPIKDARGRHLGASVEVERGRLVPVCGRDLCLTALDARTDHGAATDALYAHWDDVHPGAAA